MSRQHARPLRSDRPAPAPLLALLLAVHAAALIAPPPTHAEERDAPQKPPDEKPVRKPDAGPPAKRPGSDERGETTGNAECARVRTEARYVAYGYDHIVEVENGCEKAVQCTIATDVNPAISNLVVPPGQKRSVTTFRGSPAREFKADVACREQG
jgi:hypothetical protein